MSLYPKFLFALLLALASLSAPAQTCRTGDLTILSGKEKEGYYYKVAKAIEQVAREEGLAVCAVPVDKTFYNASELAKGHADFAIAQSDVANDAWLGAAHAFPKVRIVMPLYLEAAHILYRSNTTNTGLSGLRGKKIYMGARDSGTAFTARELLATAGLKERDYTVVTAADYCDAVARLKNPTGNRDRIDAVFRDTLVPSAEMQDFLSVNHPTSEDTLKTCNVLSDVELLSLDYAFIERLTKRGSYIGKVIRAEDYHQSGETRTVAVQALLLTSRATGDPSVRRLAEIVRHGRGRIQQKMQQLIEQQHQGDHADAVPQLSLVDIPINFALERFIHPDARESILTWPNWWNRLWWRIGIAVAIVLPFAIWKWALIARKLKQRPQIAFAVTSTLAVWFVTSCLLYRAECTVNDHFSSLVRSMQFAFLYLVSLPGYTLVTQDGLMVGQTARWLSIGLLGGFGVPLINRFIQDMLKSDTKPQAATGD